MACFFVQFVIFLFTFDKMGGINKVCIRKTFMDIPIVTVCYICTTAITRTLKLVNIEFLVHHPDHILDQGMHPAVIVHKSLMTKNIIWKMITIKDFTYTFKSRKQ